MNWLNVSCFIGATPTALERLNAIAHKRVHQAGASIFAEGAPCAGFFIVHEGLVRIYRISPEGRMHTLSLLGPLTTFNEVAAVDGGPNPYNAVAVTQSYIINVGHQLFWEWLISERALLQSYMQSLAHVNREYIERLEDMTFRSIPSRLAKLFLHETTYSGSIAETPSKLTQEDIASILGTTREVVGRALRGLFNAGLLKKQGRHILVVNRPGLEYLAETNMMPEPLGEPSPVLERRTPRPPRPKRER